MSFLRRLSSLIIILIIIADSCRIARADAYDGLFTDWLFDRARIDNLMSVYNYVETCVVDYPVLSLSPSDLLEYSASCRKAFKNMVRDIGYGGIDGISAAKNSVVNAWNNLTKEQQDEVYYIYEQSKDSNTVIDNSINLSFDFSIFGKSTINFLTLNNADDYPSLFGKTDKYEVVYPEVQFIDVDDIKAGMSYNVRSFYPFSRYYDELAESFYYNVNNNDYCKYSKFSNVKYFYVFEGDLSGSGFFHKSINLSYYKAYIGSDNPSAYDNRVYLAFLSSEDLYFSSCVLDNYYTFSINSIKVPAGSINSPYTGIGIYRGPDEDGSYAYDHYYYLLGSKRTGSNYSDYLRYNSGSYSSISSVPYSSTPISNITAKKFVINYGAGNSDGIAHEIENEIRKLFVEDDFFKNNFDDFFNNENILPKQGATLDDIYELLEYYINNKTYEGSPNVTYIYNNNYNYGDNNSTPNNNGDDDDDNSGDTNGWDFLIELIKGFGSIFDFIKDLFVNWEYYFKPPENMWDSVLSESFSFVIDNLPVEDQLAVITSLIEDSTYKPDINLSAFGDMSEDDRSIIMTTAVSAYSNTDVNFSDITINLSGQEYVILNNELIHKGADYIRPFVNAILLLLLVAFNLNQIHFIIRNTNAFRLK